MTTAGEKILAGATEALEHAKIETKLVELIKRKNECSHHIWDAYITSGHAEEAARLIMEEFELSSCKVTRVR